MESLRPSISTPQPDTTTTIVLLFSPAHDQCAWWERWLNPECAHVDILVMNPGHAVLLESYGGILAVRDLELHTAKRLIDGWDGPVLESWPAPRLAPALPFGFTTCVALAKAMVGCDSWWVQTPAQLLRWVNGNCGWWVATWSK